MSIRSPILNPHYEHLLSKQLTSPSYCSSKANSYYQQPETQSRAYISQMNQFGRKRKRTKKLFPNNLNNRSQIRQAGLFQPGLRLFDNHDKLNVQDIQGSSSDTRLLQIFKNRLYGKKSDRTQLLEQIPSSEIRLFGNQHFKKSTRHNRLHTIDAVNQNYQNDDQFNNKHLKRKDTLQQSIKNNLSLVNPQKNYFQQHNYREQSTERYNKPQRYQSLAKQSTSNSLRKWNPTHLTSRFPPLLLQNKLPPLK